VFYFCFSSTTIELNDHLIEYHPPELESIGIFSLEKKFPVLSF
jgi:hypothetical protein